MKHFCIAYELNRGERRDYDSFLAALEVFADRCHALDALWFVCTHWSAERIHARLKRHLDPEDTLLVEEMPVGQGWSGWMSQDVRDWLTKHLGPAA